MVLTPRVNSDASSSSALPPVLRHLLDAAPSAAHAYVAARGEVRGAGDSLQELRSHLVASGVVNSGGEIVSNGNISLARIALKLQQPQQQMANANEWLCKAHGEQMSERYASCPTMTCSDAWDSPDRNPNRRS